METSVYRYSFGDATPEKLPIPTLTDTDGRRIVPVSGSELHPKDIVISVYDLKTGETVQLPASEHMQMDSAKISGDLIAWSELRRTGSDLMYLHNLSSRERKSIGEQGKEYLSLQDITGDQIFLYRGSGRSLITPYEYCGMNLTTGVVTVLREILPEHAAAAVAYPLYVWNIPIDSEDQSPKQRIYAESLIERKEPLFVDMFEGILHDASGNVVVWAGWNEESDRTVTSMAAFFEDSGVSDVPSQTTTTAVSLTPSRVASTNFAIGSLAFALAGVLAIV